MKISITLAYNDDYDEDGGDMMIITSSYSFSFFLKLFSGVGISFCLWIP
jgi:hypothetical protein